MFLEISRRVVQQQLLINVLFLSSSLLVCPGVLAGDIRLSLLLYN